MNQKNNIQYTEANIEKKRFKKKKLLKKQKKYLQKTYNIITDVFKKHINYLFRNAFLFNTYHDQRQILKKWILNNFFDNRLRHPLKKLTVCFAFPIVHPTVFFSPCLDLYLSVSN